MGIHPDDLNYFCSGMRIPLFLLLLGGLFSACEPMRQPDSGTVQREMRSREIIHANPGQIAERALLLGDSLITRADARLKQNLAKGVRTSCIEAFRETGPLADTGFSVEVMRLRPDSERIAALSNTRLRQIMEAYRYNLDKHLPLAPNLQKDGDKNFIYTRPLVLEAGSCRGCHNRSASDPLAGIPGDTAGVWAVRFSKKQVVMSFIP